MRFPPACKSSMHSGPEPGHGTILNYAKFPFKRRLASSPDGSPWAHARRKSARKRQRRPDTTPQRCRGPWSDWVIPLSIAARVATVDRRGLQPIARVQALRRRGGGPRAAPVARFERSSSKRYNRNPEDGECEGPQPTSMRMTRPRASARSVTQRSRRARAVCGHGLMLSARFSGTMEPAEQGDPREPAQDSGRPRPHPCRRAPAAQHNDGPSGAALDGICIAKAAGSHGSALPRGHRACATVESGA
jgi:hypothetical protein